VAPPQRKSPTKSAYVLVGGIGADVQFSYSWLMRNGIGVRGQWIYPRDATARMVGLIRARLIRLEAFAVFEFALDLVNDAVAHSAVNSGPFKMTVVKP